MKTKSKLALAAVIGVALAIATVLFLQTSIARRYLLEKTRSYLAETAGIDLSASSLRFSLLHLSATLENVELRSLSSPGRPSFLTAGSIQATVRLTGLLHGSLSIEDVRIDRPALRIDVDERGISNLPKGAGRGAVEPHVSSSQLGVLPSRLLVSSGSISFDMRPSHVHIELPRSQLRMEESPVPGVHDLRIQSDEAGSITYEGRSLPLSLVSLDAQLGSKGIVVRKMEIDSGESRIAAAGTLDGFARPDMKLHASVEVNLDDLAGFIGLAGRAGGKVHGEVVLTGQPSRLAISAQTSGDDLFYDAYRGIAATATTEWTGGSDRIEVRALALKSPLGSARASGSLALNREAGRSRMAAQIDDLDLSALTGSLGSSVHVASLASASVEASCPGLDPRNAQGHAAIRLRPTRSKPEHDLLPIEGSLEADLSGSSLRVKLEDVASLESRWSGNVVIGSLRDLGGDLIGNSPDAEDLLAALDLFSATTTIQLAGRPHGPLKLAAHLGGTLSRPEFNANLEASGLAIGALRGVTLHAGARYTPEEVAVERADLEWQGQRLTGQGRIGLNGESPSLDLTLGTRGASVAAVLEGLGLNLAVDGTANMDADVRGTFASVDASATVTATGLSVLGEGLGRLSLQARLSGNRLELTQLQLDKPASGGPPGRVTAEGSLELANQEFSFSSTGKAVAISSLAIPGLPQLSGGLSFRVQGSGTLARPLFSADIDATAVRVGQVALENIGLHAEASTDRVALRADLPRFNLHAEAALHPVAPYTASFDIAVSQADLALLAAPSMPLKGSVSATIHGAGALASWRSGSLDATVNILDVEYRGRSVRSSGPIVMGYRDGILQTPGFSIASGDTTVQVGGSMPLTAAAGSGTLEVKAAIDPGTLLSLMPEQRVIEASGRLSLEAVIRGSLEHLEPQGRLDFTGGSLTLRGLKQPVAGISLATQLEAGALRIDKATAQFGSALLVASGVVPLGLLPARLPFGIEQKPGAARFTARLQGVQLADFAAVPPNVTGTASLELQGELPQSGDWRALSATAVFDQLNVQVSQYRIQQARPVTIGVEGGVAQVRSFELTGPETNVRVSGSAALTGNRRLDVRVDGDFDASLMSLLTGNLRLQGPAKFLLSVNGTLSSPIFNGTVDLQEGTASLPFPRLLAQNLRVRLDVNSNRVTILECEGTLNGGSITATGYVGYSGLSVNDLHVDASTKKAYFDLYGLETQADAELQLRSQDDQINVGGAVHVQQGYYRQDIQIGGTLFRFLQSGGRSGSLLGEERSPLLERLRFDVAVDTTEPLVVDNNLANLALNGSLTLIGSYYRPGLTGRITLEPGGAITFQERTFYIDNGTITFANQLRIEPDLNILATTSASGYDISLKLNGTPDKFSATFSAPNRPDLTQPDIISILMTGKPLDQTRGQSLNIARNQALSYLSGSLAGYVSHTAESSLGLTEVRIEPGFITSESNTPGVRLTLGEAITSFLRLIYSISLTNSNDQIYAVEYDVSRRLFARAIRQSDNTYRFDFQHNLPFGGGPALGSPVPAPRAKLRVGKISFEGDTLLQEKALLGKLGVKRGKPYDYFKVRKGIDRLQRYYHDRGRLEARITDTHETRGNLVDLVFHVDLGPEVTLVFKGNYVPRGARAAVRRIWSEGIFDAQRGDDAVAAVRSELVADGYLQARVEYDVITPEPGGEQAVFDINPGQHFQGVDAVFEGASASMSARLKAVFVNENLSTAVYTDPPSVTAAITRFYQQQGYLTAKVQDPRYELDASRGTGRVVIPIHEGPLFKIGKINFEGNTVFDASRLQDAARLFPGGPYRLGLESSAGYGLQQLYWQRGYNDVVVTDDVKPVPTAGVVDLQFHITENKQQIVQSIDIAGTRGTSPRFVESQIPIAAGNVLDYDKANLTRKKLYDTGAYSLVAVDAQPAPSTAGIPDVQKPMVVRIKLQEPKPYNFRYGGYYDTGRGPGFIADIVTQNLVGPGRALGVRTQYDSELQEVRPYFSQPVFHGLPIGSTAVGYLQRDLSVTNFTTNRVGFSLQQDAHLAKKLVLSYGFRYENDHTFGTTDRTLPNTSFRIDPFSVTLSRETRGDILDATSGSFFSHALEYSPSLLGADFQYLKYFGQHFWFVPLSSPVRIPLTRGQSLPRWVYAGDIRVGFIWSPAGQPIPLSERFFAGGGTTLRGFKQNEVGALDPATQQPAGGAAVFITNHELRFPLISLLGGAAFLDIGNVYPRVGDFNPFKVREAAGLGLRLRTPYFLLRADYGFKLDRRTGESIGAFFLNIGQAF